MEFVNRIIFSTSSYGFSFAIALVLAFLGGVILYGIQENIQMNSMKVKFAILILIVGLLSACGSQTADAPASTPTEQPAAPTDTPAPADTALPADASQPTTAPASSGSVSFANDVFPILKSRCINCHGGDRTEEGLVMTSYASIMAGSKNGEVVVPGDADNSLMAELVSTQKMPKRGPKLTPPQVQIIIDWINQGALDN